MTVNYLITQYSCGHSTSPQKFLPLLMPRVGAEVWCWQCKAKVIITGIIDHPVEEKPKQKRAARR